MKKRMIAILLLTMTVLAGCAEKDVYAEWEEDWAASEQTDSEAGSEEQSEETIPDELLDSNKLISYNAEEQGLIRPYELQQSENDNPNVDWAYSAFKVIEANLIKQGEAQKDKLDLSEGNFIYYAVNTEEDFLANPEDDMVYLSSSYGLNITDTFYKGLNGYNYMFIGADGKGIVSEDDVPFDESNKDKIASSIEGIMLAEEQGTAYRDKSDWILTGLTAIDHEDIEAVKKEILEKGAVQIGYEFSELNYSEGAYYTKYFGGRDMRTAAVIGWDDNYSKTNFKEGTQPEHDGAWLLYDCLGPMIGADGYIWLSYENKSTAEMVSYDITSRSKYGDVLSYDKIGYNGGIKAAGEEYTIVANVHETEEDEEIAAIGIYAFAPGQQIEVEVYTNVPDDSPSTGTLASTMTVTAERFGYQLYELENTIPINGGEKFSVVLKYANNGSDEGGVADEMFGMAPVEGPAADFSMGVQFNLNYTSAEGQSYGMRNGAWYDLSEEESAEQFGERNVLNNVCMKVLLKNKN